ncbi:MULTISPECIES: TatD family hydrolase [unclassified Pseudodesulfovibrio]|uniref:TatD family hydrolase n=1 Tax=unclassified Pseudodesulfovibrio TaxID=2661612 RepID=UPI000FEB9EAD|nr:MULTISPECIES: TatD family hydrolase [unclassified Pseudodesulfovibrio]MCJ2166133.1 TatD family hydrolase [Pseudodesulfovibrio sp. S3-i]RWU02426.1 TatD family deoxyribonuclease [Pseudodesulfovibrio sp. S3]
MGKTKRAEPESLELPRVGVDSHAHLDLDDFDEDRDEIIARATASGISQIINVFLGPDAYERNRSLFDGHPQVSFLQGVHPNQADELTGETVIRMRDQFKADPRLKGVGEIGLDYYWERVDHDVQKNAFIRQLDLARELSLPVVIHCRDANEDAVAVLESQGFKDYPVLWHCFGAGLDLARIVIDNGWHISIPGPVTFRKISDDVQAAVARIPFDRLLIETDCPYLAPEPWRGKRNHPSLMAFTAQRIAQIKGRSIQDIWQITGDNARRFFGL